MDLVTLQDGEDIARKARQIRRKILEMQQAFTNIEKCCKPVIAAVHGVCYGGGIDIITACDIRHSTKDAKFSVKEVDVGLAADVGSLNRLPKICGNEGWLKEVAFTARHFDADEALKFGEQVCRICP
ncbi:enoyl-CoA hydratase/isomerase family protein, partial [Ostertagia ostertagi]